MYLSTVLALAAAASVSAADTFHCIRPVNPIPAGPPGACCQELDASCLIPKLFTGKTCSKASKIAEADDGSTTYQACPSGSKAACCDPLLMALDHDVNIACVLPSDA